MCLQDKRSRSWDSQAACPTTSTGEFTLAYLGVVVFGRASSSLALVASQFLLGSASQTRRCLNDTNSPATVSPKFDLGTSIESCAPKATSLPSSDASISLPRISITMVCHSPALMGVSRASSVAGLSVLLWSWLSLRTVKPAGVMATRQL